MKTLKLFPKGTMKSCLFLTAAAMLLTATPSKAATWGTTYASFYSFFGFDDNWTVFELGNQNVQVQHSSTVIGDIGVGGVPGPKMGPEVDLMIQSMSTVGNTFLNNAPGANVKLKADANAHVGSSTFRNLNSDITAATNAASYFTGLPNSAASTWTSSNASLSSKLGSGPQMGQLNLNDPNESLTLTATSTTPVVFNINNFTIDHGNILTLNGTAADEFVFNIYGGFTVNNASQIKLTGGLTPSDIVYNLVKDANIDHGSTVRGTILAPNQKLSINNQSKLVGALISNGLNADNGSVIESAEN